MTVLGHRPKSGANSVEVSLSGYGHTAELWVDTDDPEDTGHAVMVYLIAQGFVYGAFYNVGNDTANQSILYQIDKPTLAPGSATVWSVVLHYRPVTPELQAHGGTPGQPVSILNRRPKIATYTNTRRETVEKAVYLGGLQTADLNAVDPPWVEGEIRAVAHSNGLGVIPQLEREDHNRIVRITRNVAAVTLSDANFPLAWINGVAFSIISRNHTIVVPQYEMKFLSWSTQEVWEEELDYVEVTFEGEIKKGGWRPEIKDEGIYQRKPYTGVGVPKYKKLVRIRDGEANRIDEPVALDGAGSMKQAGLPDFHYGKWGLYSEIDPRTYGFFAGYTS